MRQFLVREFVGKKSSFFIFRLLFILFSCAYCEEENSFDLGQSTRNINSINSLSNEGVEILINNGDEYTMEKLVNLTFKPSKNADEMLVSFESDCSKGAWEAFKTNKLLELNHPNQKNTVYVKYRHLGEQETPCVSDSIVHDDISPEVDFVNPPKPWIAERSLNIGIDVRDSGSGVKRIQCDRQGNGQFESCGQSVVYNSMAENQNHLLVVRVQDKAGNFSRPKQVNWRSDQTPPTLSLSLGPAALTADITPDFIFIPIDTGSGIARLECRVDSETQFSACQIEFSLNNLSDGLRSIEVRAVDNVGRFSASVSHSWTQDTTAPTIHFTAKPDSISKEQAVGFQFSGINDRQGITSYQCQLDRGQPQACTSPHNLTGLSDGEHRFSVIGSDAVGNSSSPIIYTWIVDTTKPTLALVEKPEEKTNSLEARFVFQARDVGSGVKEIQCKVDSEAYKICPGFVDVDNLSEGVHSFMARSLDKAGNFSDVLSYEWMVDQTRPTVSITSKPANPINEKNASFVFQAQDSGSGIEKTECRLDGGSFETCESPKDYTNLSEGEHIFSVRAEDEAGNVSSVKTYTWSVDVTGPAIEFTQKPEPIIKEQTARFQFSGINNQDVSSYECQFDGSKRPCTSGSLNLTGLSDGEHNFSVIGLDALGNKSEPISHAWTVDTVNPTLALVGKPEALISSNQAGFTFDAQDSGSGIKEIQCKVDRGNYQVCPSPMNVINLLDGSHSLVARSVDKAGNISSLATYAWTVDTLASSIEFTQKPKAITKEKTARFQFSETGGQNDIISYECQLDGGARQTCPNPHNLTGLSDGEHSLSVIGLDAANNRSVAITHRWSVDNIKPTLAFVEKPEAIIKSNQARFSFSAQDSGSGIKEIQCRVDGRNYKVCPNPMNVTNLLEGRHSLVARSVDKAGNTSDEVSHQWSVDQSLPTVSITSRPDNPTKDRNASFAFSARDNGSGVRKVECRLDGGSFGVCQDTKSYTNLAEGEHSFSVRAEDEAGNVSSVETYTWSVDTTAPRIQFSVKPEATVYIGQAAEVLFNANDGNGSGVSYYQCSFNGGGHSCAGNTSYSFSATSTQNNSFQVTVFDNAGNQSTETLNWQTKIEVTPRQATHEVLEEVPVDILFVVDTSGSMDGERRNLAQRIDGFIEQIKDMDWQIAATTTDVSNTQKDHTKGRLGDFDPGTGTHILDTSMDIDEAQTLFGNRIQAGGFPGGSDYEKGIEAAYRAVQRYVNNETPHTDFFREGAHLAIVVLSDEEAQGRYSPQQFVNFVNQSFNNKSIAWHSIVNSKGRNYKQLSNLTNGVIGDVAASNYTNQLTTIGQAVKDMQKEINLGCTPLDDDLDGSIDMEVKLKASGSNSYQVYSGVYSIQGQKLIFDDFLDPGDYQLNFNCAK